MIYGSKTKCFQVDDHTIGFLKRLEEECKVGEFDPEQEIIDEVKDKPVAVFLFTRINGNEKRYDDILGAVKLYGFKDDECWIGYFIKDKAKRLRYTSDAVEQVINLLKLEEPNIKVIKANPLINNEASIGFLKNLGFENTNRQLGKEKISILYEYYIKS